MTGGPARIRVGFDGRALSSPAGGVRRYAHELFWALAECEEQVELVALGPPPGVELPPSIIGRPARLGLPTNLGWTLAGLPLTARGASLDAFHGPAYTAPLWAMPATVLTVHDVSYARHPEWYPYRRDPIRRAFYRACARRADLLITDSEFSSQEIQAAYGIEASRIAIVPLGVGPPFVPAAPAENGNPAGSDSPYVIHVGDLHPRRNLHTALRAVLSVRQSTSALSRLRLILVGVDRGSAAQLEELVGSAGQRDSLVFKNAVSDEELAELYRSALALVYPSRYEGFGLPLVEAMACGTPVVASNAGSIPEVVGSASRLLDPDDVDGFAAAISGIATDAGLRARLRDASLERASRFSWQRVARDTIEVYRRVARV